MARIRMVFLVSSQHSREFLDELSRVLTEKLGVTDKRLMLFRPIDAEQGLLGNQEKQIPPASDGG